MDNYLYMIKCLNDAAERQVNRRLRQFDLTFSQVRIMFLLKHSPRGCYTMKELEQIFAVSQQTMAGIVKRLEMKGLLTASWDNGERRGKIVKLTPEGEKLDTMVKDRMEIQEKKLTEGISAEEMVIFQRVLRRMTDNVNEMEAVEGDE